MNKLTLTGIILVVFSIGLVYLSSLQFQSNFSGGNIHALSLGPNSTIYSPFNVSGNTIVGTVYFVNGSRVDYLLLSNQGFLYLHNKTGNTTLLKYAESKGTVLEAAQNSTAGAFPSSGQSGPVYTYNNSPAIPAGTYYNVFHNRNNTNTTIYYSTILKPQSDINNALMSTAGYGIVAAAMLLAGIIAIIYSIFIKKGKEEEKSVKDEDIYKIYEKEERKAARSRKRKTNKR